MTTEAFLSQSVVYLGAAVVSVPVARRLGLGSVLGYLLAGMAIGPFGLGLVGAEGEDVMHFAEFGVVMMLFIVGLELQPALLWRLRGPIVGLGGLQVGLTGAAVTGISVALGLPVAQAVAVGMIAALSSTAIVLQSLQEKGLARTEAGQSAFSVLLFQDMAVIPMLALLPLLAAGDAGHAAEAGHAATTTWITGLPAWLQTLVVLGAVASVIVAGRLLVRPLFRALGRTGLREIFVAAALLLVIGTAVLMIRVGLSPALGTFLAGVVLADSEYRHELEADLEPFKGLLLGLFFIAVGASLDFALVAEQPGVIAALTGGAVVLKLAILLVLARLFKLAWDQTLIFAFALPQVGEFAFVLFSFAGQEGVLPASVTGIGVAVTALTMAVTPLLMVANERLLLPRVGTRVTDERSSDAVHEHNPVLVAGYGSFGSTLGRFLRASGVGVTVLDVDSDRVDLLRRMGQKVFYGDATRHDLLATAGAADAQVLVLALDTADKTQRMVETARRHFPHLRIYARAFDWPDAHELVERDVDGVVREALDASLRLGQQVLHGLGFRAYEARRSAGIFMRHDEAALKELAGTHRDGERYLGEARSRIQRLEEVLEAERADEGEERDLGWDPESLREEFGG